MPPILIVGASGAEARLALEEMMRLRFVLVIARDRVLRWAAKAGRDLPWRRTRDPWAVLVSELMLQQTQVTRVVPKYEAFLARFPDPASCAEAPAAETVRLWAGLGY